MSILRTRLENELMGGWDYDVLDSFYPPPKGAPKVESQTVAEKEPGNPSPSLPLDTERGPRSIALAVIASNAVHAAWEAGYKLGFNQGRLAGLDKAVEIGNPDFRPTYPSGDKPF